MTVPGSRSKSALPSCDASIAAPRVTRVPASDSRSQPQLHAPTAATSRSWTAHWAAPASPFRSRWLHEIRARGCAGSAASDAVPRATHRLDQPRGVAELASNAPDEDVHDVRGPG